MSDTIRWGILGAGNIARKFAEGLRALPDAELVAIGSRTPEKAKQFGDEFDVPRRCGSYEEFATVPDIDVVYVATPHPMHKENTILCLNAGKAVLCEKPFTINADEARQVIACARQQGLFLMEAMWTRFLPVIRRVREWLDSGEIGEARMLTADFGFRAGLNPEGRLFKLALGGGSLLDVGVYTVALASMIFRRPPNRVTGIAAIGETGADEQAAFVFGYDKGELALLSSAVRTNTPQEARIDGTQGRIHIDAFWHATRAMLNADGKAPQTVEMPLTGNGYNYEAAAVMNCLRDGKLESDIMPLDETVAIMETMDELRRQWNLKYPME